MDLTRTAFGTWNGGRFMHFGEPLTDDRFIAVTRRAYEKGIRTFMTADVYGNGAADEMLAKALEGFPRDSYCLVGAIGHDFYATKRDGAKGFPRFTDPRIRQPQDFAAYLEMAAEKSLQRLKASKFDCLLLHNPDSIGYSSDLVWKGLEKLRDSGLTDMLGVAPGPANGFTLDLIQCFERFGPLIDWAMIILNPLEPWPGSLCLPAAVKNDIKIITRVVDYGGLFHDDVKPGHKFGEWDHRTYRPKGWVEAGFGKIEQFRSIATKHNLTLLQLAAIWNLSQANVFSVIPTLIQEIDTDSKPIEQKIDELAALPDVTLTPADRALIAEVGDNKGCMDLKGGNPAHSGEPLPDRWSLTPDLEATGKRWGIEPNRDLTNTHAPAA